MKVMTSLILLFSFNIFSQTIEQAKKNRNDFIEVLKIIDLPEGKKEIEKLIFKNNSSFPVISSCNIIFESTFETDSQKVLGYKSLVEIISNGNSFRFLLISYYDKLDKKWKVFEFRKNEDIEYEVSQAEKTLESKTDSRKLQYRLRNLAYWELMNGKILSAKKHLEDSLIEAAKNNDTDFKASNLDIVSKIE